VAAGVEEAKTVVVAKSTTSAATTNNRLDPRFERRLQVLFIA
jgi:hypothetical protein